MDPFHILILLISGLAGGNAAAAMFPDKSLGMAWNTISGLVGGALGSLALMSALGIADGASAYIQNAAGGGAGGALLMLFVGALSARHR
jgi:uncharacterized membrane protein YeaQ/YmgE (transglycosylase-associated protein family)